MRMQPLVHVAKSITHVKDTHDKYYEVTVTKDNIVFSYEDGMDGCTYELKFALDTLCLWKSDGTLVIEELSEVFKTYKLVIAKPLPYITRKKG